MSQAIYLFEKPEVCRACGGSCCKNYAGACVPADFGEEKLPAPDFHQRVREAVIGGQYVIDYWEGDPRNEGELPEYGEDFSLERGYFIRPAHKSAYLGLSRYIDASWGGECVFLASSGCTLAHEDRPLGCRALEPIENPRERGAGCRVHGGDKRSAALAWLPYAQLIKDIIAEGLRGVL
jgi:Fe-S-cluster containining protein